MRCFDSVCLILCCALFTGCCTHPPDNTWMTAPSGQHALDAVAVDMSQFHVGNAYISALACDAAYLPSIEAEAALRNWGFQNPVTINNSAGSVQCCVASDTRFVLVAFKGSSAANFPDWWTDFDAQLVAVPELVSAQRDAESPALYTGFADAMDSIWADLLRAVTDAATTGRDEGAPKLIWVTGHGRGGALATVAAFRLARAGHHIAAVYTFGQPRVGNRAFADVYDSLHFPHYRVVYGSDPVPQLPRSDAGRHVGSAFTLKADGVIANTSPHAPDEARLRELMDSRVELLHEHHIRRVYLQSLYTAAKLSPELASAPLPHPASFDVALRDRRPATQPATKPATALAP